MPESVETLGKTRQKRLSHLEQTIESGLRAFVRVGKALTEIRDDGERPDVEQHLSPKEPSWIARWRHRRQPLHEYAGRLQPTTRASTQSSV